MKTAAKTADEYLALLPPDRREAIAAVAATVRRHLPKGYSEGFGWGMLCWQVPLSVYPDTYNGQPLVYAALASQKQYMALYLMCAYARPEVDAMLREGFRAAGKRLDMGKSCIRFRRLEDLPLDVIARAVASTPLAAYVAAAERSRGTGARKSSATKRPAAKATARKSAKPRATAARARRS
jgi:hypothetical protein